MVRAVRARSAGSRRHDDLERATGAFTRRTRGGRAEYFDCVLPVRRADLQARRPLLPPSCRALACASCCPCYRTRRRCLRSSCRRHRICRRHCRRGHHRRPRFTRRRRIAVTCGAPRPTPAPPARLLLPPAASDRPACLSRADLSLRPSGGLARGRARRALARLAPRLRHRRDRGRAGACGAGGAGGPRDSSRQAPTPFVLPRDGTRAAATRTRGGGAHGATARVARTRAVARVLRISWHGAGVSGAYQADMRERIRLIRELIPV